MLNQHDIKYVTYGEPKSKKFTDYPITITLHINRLFLKTKLTEHIELYFSLVK